MSRPGVVVLSRAEAPPRSAPTDAGMAFMIGATASGPTEATTVRSFGEYQDAFGARTGTGTAMFDAVEAYFREGGSRLTVARAADVAAADASLAALPAALGPGQVLAPTAAIGQDPDVQASLIAHAAANNRIALLDAAEDSTSAELVTLAGTYSAGENARYAALFAPAASVRGSDNVIRTVGWSAIQAGIIARNDALNSPNVPAAGINGQSRTAIDLSAIFTDAEREDLNEAGVDVARLIYGTAEAYGYRTLADVDTGWGSLANARLNMAIVAKCQAIGERYVFSQIDGRGVKLSQFGAELSGMLAGYWAQDALFGTTADDAFYVDVGPAVNTPTTIANGELHAVIGLRMSPFAEYVVIEVVKTATDESLSVAPGGGGDLTPS